MQDKIELIIFDEYESRNSWVNIGYLSSSLKTLPNIETIVSFYTFNKIKNAIENTVMNGAAIIGLPILQNNFIEVLDFVKRVKNIRKDVFIFLGNKEATSNYNYVLERYDSVDAIIVGEGENTLKELVTVLLEKQDWMKVQGLAYKDKGKICFNAPVQIIENIDNIPFPDRTFRKGKHNSYNVLGSRGCLGYCTFCEANSIFGDFDIHNVRVRSIVNVVDEIQELSVNHNYIYITFLDSTFCAKNEHASERLHELYNELIKRKINMNFAINVRTEQVNVKMLNEIIRLREVGLDYVLIGLETGNKEDMNLYGKQASLDDNMNAISMLKENGILYGELGIEFEYGFININPYSTLDKLIENIDFLESNQLIVHSSDLLSRLRISKGARLSKKIRNDGLLNECNQEIIIEPYGYYYIDSRVANVYDEFERLCNDFDIPAYPNLVSKIYQLNKLVLNNKYELKMFIDYKKEASSFFLKLFRAVVRKYYYGYDNHEIDRIIKKYKRSIITKKNGIDILNKRVSMILLKYDMLVY